MFHKHLRLILSLIANAKSLRKSNLRLIVTLYEIGPKCSIEAERVKRMVPIYALDHQPFVVVLCEQNIRPQNSEVTSMSSFKTCFNHHMYVSQS